MCHCFIMRWILNWISEEFNIFRLVRLPESTYRHQANIDDEVVTMEILDTAGQVREIDLLI